MKLGCRCGHVIRDGTDNLPYKAQYVADQDFADLNRMTAEQIHNAYWDYHRVMYQCPQCGRLFLEREGSRQMLVFKPEGHGQRRVLGSMRGREYKIGLRGKWYKFSEPVGVLEWDDAGDLLGASERFDNWEALQQRYSEMKDTLIRENRLRHAWLEGAGGVVDEWFADTDETEAP